MLSREAEALRMSSDLREAQRTRILDQHPQDAAAARQIADGTVRVRVDPDREKALELAALLVEHAERRVARSRDSHRLVDDAAQHRLGIELGNERPTHLGKAADLVDIACGAHQPPVRASRGASATDGEYPLSRRCPYFSEQLTTASTRCRGTGERPS